MGDNHIILIRFNQDTEFRKDDIYQGDPSWMDHRFKLFEKYTLKSFQNQTDKAFHVILLCDPKTPSKYRDVLNQYVKEYSFIAGIVWNNGSTSEELKTDVMSLYQTVRKNNSSNVVTSRCDNDDLVAHTYNEACKLVTSQVDTTISWATGMTMSHEDNLEYYSFHFPHGPFISTISTLENWKSPFQTNHHDIGSTPIETPYPMWCWIVHDKNAHNTLKGINSKWSMKEIQSIFSI